MTYDLVVAIAAVVAGGIAAVSGFGVGSLLTPVLAAKYGTKAAVAIVAVPHLVGTIVRFASLWRWLKKDRFCFTPFSKTRNSSSVRSVT